MKPFEIIGNLVIDIFNTLSKLGGQGIAALPGILEYLNKNILKLTKLDSKQVISGKPTVSPRKQKKSNTGDSEAYQRIMSKAKKRTQQEQVVRKHNTLSTMPRAPKPTRWTFNGLPIDADPNQPYTKVEFNPLTETWEVVTIMPKGDTETRVKTFVPRGSQVMENPREILRRAEINNIQALRQFGNRKNPGAKK